MLYKRNASWLDVPDRIMDSRGKLREQQKSTFFLLSTLIHKPVRSYITSQASEVL